MQKLGRVAVLIPSLSGGAFTILGPTIAKGLALLGVDVELLTVKSPTPEQVSALGPITFVSLGSQRSAFAVPALVRYLRSQRPDVLISMPALVNFLAITATRVARTGCLLIISEHTNMTLDAELVYPNKPKLRLIPVLTNALYPMADGLFAPSREIFRNPAFAANTRRCHYPKAIIPNPLSWDFAYSRGNRLPPPSHPWLQSNRIIPAFVSVGRLSHEKGFDTLLKASWELQARGAPSRFLIIGESGPASYELRELHSRLALKSWVQFLGYQDNVLNYMASSDGLVMTSRSEPFGLVLTEAMALGLPIVATNAPGGPQEYLKAGVNALVVPVDDVCALSDAIENLTSSETLAGQLGFHALQSAGQFHPERVASQYLEFITVCAKARDRRLQGYP